MLHTPLQVGAAPPQQRRQPGSHCCSSHGSSCSTSSSSRRCSSSSSSFAAPWLHHCTSAKQLSLMAAGAAATAAAALVGAAAPFLAPPAVQAHIAFESKQPTLLQQQQERSRQLVLEQSQAAFDPNVAAAGRHAGASAPSTASRGSSSSSAIQQRPPSRANRALVALTAANDALSRGDSSAALEAYSSVVEGFPDLALTDYARLGRAICLYQEGRTEPALVQLNELEVTMRGNPEAHAALAAVLYAERPNQRWRAEEQLEIAYEFAPQFSDPAWVAAQHHWPPRLMDALTALLALR